jgi:hypothetical protein
MYECLLTAQNSLGEPFLVVGMQTTAMTSEETIAILMQKKGTIEAFGGQVSAVDGRYYLYIVSELLNI